ncbi:hypothetical protein KR018_011939 [Drosophila ironensis]|nr:hypothetical protein KR018_011939 [Drosophila ironensis]
MGQGGSAKSVSNFAIFLLLLILQNCGQARSQRRDGLAKLEFNETAPPVFNFAKIYQSLYAQLLQGTVVSLPPPAIEGRSRISGKPFHVLEQLQHDFEAKWQRTTTVKPFSIVQHLDFEHEQEYQRLHARPNSSFHVLEALYQDQKAHDRKTTSSKPFHVIQQLERDLIAKEKHTTTVKPFSLLGALASNAVKKLEKEGFETQKPANNGVDPPAEHKSEPKPQSRAKESQKRKRKRIRRRRKRIRRRRKRTRRRRRKKRKKRRKKRKKKKHKGDKKKKKKKGKRKRKRKKQQKPEHSPEHSIFQPGQVIFANPTKQPYYHHHHPPGYPYPTNNPMQTLQTIPTALLATLTAGTTTTKKPKTTTTTHPPFSKIKYLLRHNSIFKKKKKEYLSHVGQVLYPFVKFVAFFTVLNPFTLGVFLFTLISPAVFGFLGFVALSILVKPFLHLVFGVKRNVDAIDRKRWLANRQAEKLKLGLRPVTIHKHYYQQKPVVSAPPVKLRPVGHWRREDEGQVAPRVPPLRPPQATLHPPPRLRHNPLLPDQRRALDMHYDYG